MKGWRINRKAVVVAIVSAILIILGGVTKAEYVDLMDAEVKSQMIPCDIYFACVIVEKTVEKDKVKTVTRYFVQFDEKGIVRIYELDTDDQPTLKWAKDLL